MVCQVISPSKGSGVSSLTCKFVWSSLNYKFGKSSHFKWHFSLFSISSQVLLQSGVTPCWQLSLGLTLCPLVSLGLLGSIRCYSTGSSGVTPLAALTLRCGGGLEPLKLRLNTTATHLPTIALGEIKKEILAWMSKNKKKEIYKLPLTPMKKIKSNLLHPATPIQPLHYHTWLSCPHHF